MESIFRARTTIPKYFDKKFEHNVGESQRRRFGGRKSKYRKPHNHSRGQITQELFLTFLRPGPRQRGEMVLPGAIWQETTKVDGADMSPSLLSTMTQVWPQTFILTCKSIFLRCHVWPLLIQNAHKEHMKKSSNTRSQSLPEALRLSPGRREQIKMYGNKVPVCTLHHKYWVVLHFTPVRRSFFGQTNAPF